MSGAYYNEIDPRAAQWLRQLIADGHIADGEVDERSIEDVTPNDLNGFTQCHFFAGIGVWSYALRQAGWPDDRPVWTGSAPCQPFSSAGQGRGKEDERHLWPEMLRLIKACRPEVIFGEQVGGAVVTGTISDDREDLRSMPERAAVYRVLCELKGKLSNEMQDLRAGHGKGAEAGESDKMSNRLQDVARETSGLRIGECSQEQSQEKRDSVRPGSGRHTGEDRQRLVRTNGDSVRPGNAEGVECSESGSDRAVRWLYEREHESCPVCGECHGEHMGRSEDCRDWAADNSQANREIERIVKSLGREVEGEVKTTWLPALQHDLDREGYAVGSCVTPACGFGAPHIRKRLYWVADANSQRTRRDRGGFLSPQGKGGDQSDDNGAELRGRARQLADAASQGSQGRHGRSSDSKRTQQRPKRLCEVNRPGPTNGFWRDADWLGCTDEKWRPVEPGAFPLADGAPARVGRLRGYGNAIVAPQAQAFIEAYMEQEGEPKQ